MGHHSTSDDSSVYRSRDEVENRREFDNPIIRLRKYMYNNGIWNEATDKQWMAAARQEVRIFRQKIKTRCTMCDQLEILIFLTFV